MKRGFTLIELLVVVLIIAILSAIALPQYQKAVERSRMAEAVQVLGSLASAQQINYMREGVFAGNFEEIQKSDPSLKDPSDKDKWSFFIKGDDSLAHMEAVREAGIFEGGTLILEVQPSGAITKECIPSKKKQGFCPLAEAAGYKERVKLPGTVCDTPGPHKVGPDGKVVCGGEARKPISNEVIEHKEFPPLEEFLAEEEEESMAETAAEEEEEFMEEAEEEEESMDATEAEEVEQFVSKKAEQEFKVEDAAAKKAVKQIEDSQDSATKAVKKEMSDKSLHELLQKQATVQPIEALQEAEVAETATYEVEAAK